MTMSLIPLILMAVLTITGTVGFVLPERYILDNSLDLDDYAEYPVKIQSKEKYPVMVTKRAAVLLDRLMVALQNIVEDRNRGIGVGGPDRSVRASEQPHHSVASTSLNADKSSINRRAQGKGRVYWRCYFNAVTCFK